MKEIGIYIHIPFCASKCAYCDFISFDKKEEYISKYIESLKSEIETSEILNNSKVNTIYIGGGTPSYIDSKYIVQIIDIIKEKCDLSSTEITIEMNPGTVTQDKLQDYYNAGINRVSIGLQTTNDNLLKTIGRIHNCEQFLNTYKLARQVRI
ncbi:MAG: radical SAM protein [Clostridia bacterium]|nr:radical SAM protein [Clostridia bacterium]